MKLDETRPPQRSNKQGVHDLGALTIESRADSLPEVVVPASPVQELLQVIVYAVAGGGAAR